jgi:3-hydroxyisobutyrate dehydrogenase-like beta-hydroxyacid dehydrogenase
MYGTRPIEDREIGAGQEVCDGCMSISECAAEPMSSVVGFIGAGQMGEPMVRRLLAADNDVHVYARRDDVRARLGTLGATVTASVAELAARSDVVISCVYSDEQLMDIALGPAGVIANAKDGAVMVSHTTGRAATVVAMANSSPRICLLDAPVSGTAADIDEGPLTVLIGGDFAAVERVTPLLGEYAHPLVHTGSLGTALNIKLINNLLFAANAQIVSAATKLGQRVGVDEMRLLDALEVCSGGSRLTSYARQFGGIDVFAAGAGPVLRKDVAACVDAAGAAGADLGLLLQVVESGPIDLTNAGV